MQLNLKLWINGPMCDPKPFLKISVDAAKIHEAEMDLRMYKSLIL